MSWWKPLVVIIVPPLALLALQVLLYLVVGVIEGSDDPLSATITPLKFLAVNLSTFAAGVLAILLLARMAKVPWRSLISSPRAFDGRRLAQYLLAAAVLVAAGIGVVAMVAPDAPGWVAFGVSGTTIVMLVLTVLSTPLQTTGEELIFRGAALPAAASWVRAVRPALAVGLVVSSLGFAWVHGSSDPWLFGYYTFVGVCTGLMAIISRGIEAPVAFHIANNILFTTVNTLMADGEPFSIDRSSDTGDASLLILAAVNIAMVVLVWLRERRARVPASDPPMASLGAFGEWRRQRAINRLRRGDGRLLQRFRWWQGLLGRVLFYLELSGSGGRRHIYAVEVWRFSEEVRAHLYLDGRHHAASKTPAVFPVEGGVIEVAVSDTVVRRCHYVADDGTERRLTPDPKSAGGRRVRFDREHPALARLIEFASVLVLVIGLGLQALQALEPISQIPLLADNFGTFESPIHLSLWLNLALAFVAGLAARERALRLRYNPLLD